MPDTCCVHNMTKMWGAFFLSILLVSTLNFYAVVREPDRVEISDIHEHVQETVKVEGTLISWIADPYSDGSDRIDLQIEDDYDVVKVQWRDTSDDMPPIGSTVIVEGQVREYNGKIYIESKGMGAVTQKESAGVEELGLTLSDFAKNSSDYENEIIRITGYISSPISPSDTYQTFTLTDNPTYLNSDHRLYVSLQGRTDAWIEAGSKVNVTGWVQFDERNYRWLIVVQSSTVDVLNPEGAKRMSWDSTMEIWSYDIGKLVTISGDLTVTEEGEFWIYDPSGSNARVCLIPNIDLFWNPSTGRGEFEGRLAWSDEKVQICLEMSELPDYTSPAPSNGPYEYTPLIDIAENIEEWKNKIVNISGVIKYTVEPGKDGYIADGTYDAGYNTSIRFTCVCAHDYWLEEGQEVQMLGAEVTWDTRNSRIELVAQTIEVVGDTPPPEPFGWNKGWADWKYQIGVHVTVAGTLNTTDDGNMWIVRSGTDERMCLYDDGSANNLQYNSEGVSNGVITWIGRLTYADSIETALCLTLEPGTA